MKHSLSLLYFLSLCLSLVAQEKDNDGFITTPSGLKYKITKETSGPRPNPGDKITAHYTGKLTNDTVFDSSVKRGTPFQFKLGKGQVIKGWDEGFALLKKGEKAILVIPPDLGYGARANGKIPANATLIFDVELINFEEGFVPKPYIVKDIPLKPTGSGLQYQMVHSIPGSEHPEKGDKVSVHYTGYLEDGKMFDSSLERGKPITFTLGKKMVIEGWDEGIKLLGKGEKARLTIPYQLAYGENGRPPAIPAKANLIFDVELVDFEKGTEVKPYPTAGKDTLKTESGLKYIMVQKNPAGAKPQSGKQVQVHYSGYLTDGSMFDSSVERGQPFAFNLGQGHVIKGWDEGILLLREGEKARLIVPHQLGYGENGFPPVIPSKATLVFDVEVVKAIAP